MLLPILIGIAAVVVLFIVFVATRPPDFHVERSITIAAPPESAFAQVNDFHAWAAWSPFEKLDPQMTKTFEGPQSGTGAIYTWAGNGQAGEGRMTIEKSVMPSLIAIKLEFFKPFAATNKATFTFAPGREGTKVTWAMDGSCNFMMKAMHLIMNMDKTIGGAFERGLISLKALAESRSKANAGAADSAR